MKILIVLSCLLSGYLTAEPNVCLALNARSGPELTIRCLNSVKEIVDYVYIANFNSHPHYTKIIENYLVNHHIQGKLDTLSYENEQTNRMTALYNMQAMIEELGYEPSETYILALDDDSTVKIGDGFNKIDLKEDAYSLFETTPCFSFFNAHLLKASLKWENTSGVFHHWETDSSLGRHKYIPLKIEGPKEISRDTLLNWVVTIEQELATQGIKNPHCLFLAALYATLQNYNEAITWAMNGLNLEPDRETQWFIKYLLGQCHEKLDEWVDAQYWYLNAFQTNPQHGEPLQRLALYYRTKGQNDLSYLFAHHALQLPLSKEQIYYDASPLQTYQTEQEISIAAFYTPFKEKGLESLNRIVLQKAAPWSFKWQAYHNMVYYVHNLVRQDLKPLLFDLPLIRKDRPEHFMPTNPSITKTDNGYDLILRSVNYTQKGTLNYNTLDPDGIYRTKNFFIRYDRDFNILSKQEITDNPHRIKKKSVEVEGLEDCRIFHLNGDPWVTCTTVDTSPYNYQISACRLEPSQESDTLVAKTLIPFLGPDPYRCEKNWTPFIHEAKLKMVYSYDPFIIYEPDLKTGECKTTFKLQPDWDFSQFRGSAAPIEFDNGYLLLVHEIIHKNDQSRIYLHRFLYTDKEWMPQKASLPFTFLHQGVEFCCSMTLSHAGDQLILPIGFEDSQAFLLFVSTADIRSLLHPLPTPQPQKPY